MRNVLGRSAIFAAIAVLACGATRAAAQECKTSNGKCDVDVRVTEPCNTKGNTFVVPDTLELAGKRNVSITWNLPRNYRFCRASNDGVTFKGESDGQFTDPGFDDNQGGGCHKKHKWKNKNDPSTAGKTYSYLLKFTGPNGTCVLDPFVRNG